MDVLGGTHLFLARMEGPCKDFREPNLFAPFTYMFFLYQLWHG